MLDKVGVTALLSEVDKREEREVMKLESSVVVIFLLTVSRKGEASQALYTVRLSGAGGCGGVRGGGAARGERKEGRRSSLILKSIERLSSSTRANDG